jgi:hypothetical protein
MMTFESPLEEAPLLPPGTYSFEVIGWTLHKEPRPLGPDKAMCQSVDYEIMCTNGVSPEGSKIVETGTIKGTLKLVAILQWILMQYFLAVGDRKHGQQKFIPDWSMAHNIGLVGRVQIKHRKGSSRSFAEVEKWLDAEESAVADDPHV